MGEENIYYDFGTLLSKNALINMTLSNRGAGKTYGFTKWAIKDFLKTGKQFVYLRRYSTELSRLDNFFDAVCGEFPDHKFMYKGGKKGGKFFIDDEICGFSAPLSTSITLKSVPFPEVNKICFDEFLIPKGNIHYLKDECHTFFDFIETINRLRQTDKLHDLVRVFCFANTISMVNPYFQYFGLTVNTSKRFNIYKEYNNDVIVEIYKNTNYIEAKKETRMGKIMEKTAYGDYAIDGEFYQDDDTFIEAKTKQAQNMVTVRYMDKTVGFWFDYNDGKIYASYKTNPNCVWKFSLTSADHCPNYFLVKNAASQPQMQTLSAAFQHGCMYFENLNVKESVYKIMQLLCIRGG